MAAKSKSDISNDAIRIFLQMVGEFYDNSRGFEKFKPSKKQVLELLNYFDNKCCYCGVVINEETYTMDHLIPTNKNNLGLHAWGNVVPCCSKCNKEKHQKNWEEFLKVKNIDLNNFNKKKQKIIDFIKSKKYDPTLDLRNIVENLYEDIGEVAMTLINLRYKQAEELIKGLEK